MRRRIAPAGRLKRGQLPPHRSHYLDSRIIRTGPTGSVPWPGAFPFAVRIIRTLRGRRRPCRPLTAIRTYGGRASLEPACPACRSGLVWHSAVRRNAKRPAGLDASSSALGSVGSVGMNYSQEDDYLTVSEIAARLKVNPETVRNWITRDELRAVCVGARRVRILPADLDSFLVATGATPLRDPIRERTRCDRADRAVRRSATDRASRAGCRSRGRPGGRAPHTDRRR